MTSYKQSDEDVTDLGRNGFVILQKKQGYRFGMDAVLLAHFAEVKKSHKAADLCTGSGIIPLLMAALHGGTYDCVELLEDTAGMAVRSMIINGVERNINIINGDIRDRQTLPQGVYDSVTANPPYLPLTTGKPSSMPETDTAKHEKDCTITDVCGAAFRALKNKGSFYMVHRTSRLTDVIMSLKENRLEPKVLRFVHPYADKPSVIFLVKSVKNASAGVHVQPPLVVYDGLGAYTNELREIYTSK